MITKIEDFFTMVYTCIIHDEDAEWSGKWGAKRKLKDLFGIEEGHGLFIHTT
jgi:hypothetical protein